MKMYRKLLAVMMAASMLLTMLPPTAYAEEWEAEMTDPGDDMLVPDDGTEELDEDLGEDLVVSDPDDLADDEYILPEIPAEDEEDLLILDPDELEEEDPEEEDLDVPDEAEALLDDDASAPDLDLSDPDPSSLMPALVLQDNDVDATLADALELTLNTATAPFTLDVGETAVFSYTSVEGIQLFHAITNEEVSLSWNLTYPDGKTTVDNVNYSALDASTALGEGLTWYVYLTNADNPGPVELSLIVYPMIPIGVDSGDIAFFERTYNATTATNITAYICPYVAAPMYLGSWSADTSKVWKLEDYTAYFDGWCDENGNIIRDNDFTSVPKGSVLTANWIKKISVTLWSPSGNILDLTDPSHPVTLSYYAQIYLPYGITLGELNRMYKTETIDGNRFICWYSDNTNDETYQIRNGVYCDADHSSESYTPINIGETMSVTIEAGGSAGMLFTPEHDGMYSFRAVADNDEASNTFSLISIRDDVTGNLMTNDYSNFRNGPAITSAWLTGGKTYRAVINHNNASIATTFTYSINRVLSVMVDPNGGSVYADFKNNYTATRVAIASDSGTIADLTNAYTCAGSARNTFVGWALSKDASAPAADDLELEEGQTYYAVYASLPVIGEFTALREWKSVTEPSSTSVMYSFTVPDGAADPYMLYIGIKAEHTTTLEIYDDNEQLVDQTNTTNGGIGVPLSPGHSYLIKLSSTTSAGISCELCAAEMSPVTLHSATAFRFEKGGMPADIVHGYYVPHAIELYGHYPDYYTNGYMVYYSSSEYYDYYFRGFGTDPDGPALSDEELDALSGQYTDLYVIGKRQIKVCLDPGEDATLYDSNGSSISSYQWIDDGTSIHDLNAWYQGRKGEGIDYAFVGWADSPDATEALPETDRIRADTTLYAIYTEQTFEPLAVNTPKTVTLNAGYSKWFRMTTGSSSRSIHYLLYVTAESKGLRADVYNENGNLVGFEFRSNEKKHDIYKYLYLEPETTYLIEVNASKDCSLTVGAETLLGIYADACGGKVTDEFETYEDTFYTEVSPHKGIAYGWTIEPPKEHTFLGWTATKGSHTLLSTEDGLPAEGSTVYAAYDGTHTYGDYYVTKLPTTEQEGSNYHICKVCGYKETVPIAKLEPVSVNTSKTVTYTAGSHKWFCMTTDSGSPSMYLLYANAEADELNAIIYEENGTFVGNIYGYDKQTNEIYRYASLDADTTYLIEVIANEDCSLTVGTEKLVRVKADSCGGKVSDETTTYDEVFSISVGSSHEIAFGYTIEPPKGHTFLGWTATKGSHTLINTAKALPTEGSTIYAAYDGTHTYGDYVVTKQPTALQAGSKYHICKVCGYKETTSIAKLAPVVKFNVTSLQMQKAQVCKKVTVSMAKDDYIKSWKSSNTAIVKVTGTVGTTTANKTVACTLTAGAATGTAYVTVTLASGKTGKLLVKVQAGSVVTTALKLTAPKPTNTSGTIGSVTVVKNNSYAIKVTRTAPFTANDTLKYASTNTAIATVSAKGSIKGIKNGTCKVYVKNSANKILATVNVTVKSTIKVNASSLTLQKKQVFKGFKVTMTTGDYVTSWKSSNTNIFTVSGGTGATNGKAGTCKITAKAPTSSSSVAYLTVKLHSGLSKKIKVTVRTAKVSTATMILTAPVPTNTAKTIGKVTVSVGKTYAIKVTRAPITTQDTLTYTSSNKAIATVTSTGVIKGIKAGTCKITIKSGAKQAYVTVTVK